jgi:Zn-dependent metalloprotease
MKKLFVLIISVIFFLNLQAQEYFGSQAEEMITGAKEIRIYPETAIPAFLSFRQGYSIDPNNFKSWMVENFKMNTDLDFVLINTESDQLGYVHYRYKQTYKGRMLDESMYILHTMGGKVASMNGFAYTNPVLEAQPKITEQNALSAALSSISAERYKWQMPDEEQHLKSETNDPNASYYPKAELVYIHAGKNARSANLRLAYKFNIYADLPVSRAYYFIDAVTGELLGKTDIIHHADVKGTAHTKYSGIQTITTDSMNATTYRLRELGRGKGIQTMNMKKGTSYSAAVDFNDSDNVWNNVNANKDEAATDAHWGAEMTYDYFFNVHNRNSIDNNGFALKSYVHYSVNYANAFWDGQRMTFGDGNASLPPFTVFDVIGHEITHGLVSYTASLSGGESGALNESFADIFGTMIEWYSKPTQANWIMGDNIIPIRNMANPKLLGDPDTYFGQNWDSIGNETHRNSTVQSFWFYLLINGGKGTNDLGNVFDVTGIGREKAEKIAFRLLVTYLTSTSDYYDSRYYSIKAAGDLYGECSAEVIAVINAWYAVGIGKQQRTIDFDANMKVFCKAPFTVKFTNNSDAYSGFIWDFGDGSTSFLRNPSHTYTTYGKFTVKLKGTTECGINDSIVKTEYVIIDTNSPCTYLMPSTASPSTVNECKGLLLDNGGYGNYSNGLTSTFSIVSSGNRSIILNFKSFEFEECTNPECDVLYIYDGPNASSTLIGKYTGNSLPNGGTIISTGPAITLKQVSDPASSLSGFELEWTCSDPTLPPVTNFIVENESDCNGKVKFLDKTYNGATSWLWLFGDGSTSTERHPEHVYKSKGTYTVTLTSSNDNGSTTETKQDVVNISFPLQTPTVTDINKCSPDSFTITIPKTDNSLIEWYDSWNSSTPIDTGYVFKTPYLTESKDYFIQSKSATEPSFMQPIDNTAGAGGNYSNNTTHYLIFDAYKEFTLKSVKVYSNSLANRKIELLDSKGNLIKDTTVYIPTGESRVNLNFSVPKGYNYKIGVKAPVNLYRNTSGIAMPITLPGVLSIIGTSAGSSGYYYFLYNWEVLETSCYSERTKMSIYITDPQVSFNYTNSGKIYSFVNTTQGSGNDILWDFGDGTNSSTENPVHEYTIPGQYIVKLVVNTPCGKDSINKTINIAASINQTDATERLTVFPNPTNSYVNIRFVSAVNQNSSMILINSLGKVIISKNIITNGIFEESINMADYGKGIYYLQIVNKSGKSVRKIVVN